ncbi:MAG TPA: hypothetical protein PK340_05820 [Bacilli bacterium]|nr:hypothetical protein [Bacilli bacterium]
MKKGLLKLILTAALSVASASVIAITYAAYLNHDKYIHPVDVNTVGLATHFAGGTGTSSDPYLVSNSTQLRNLQKLTTLGVFRTDANFALSASFIWDNTDGPLLPIGTEDNPFYGTFDGRGNIISNLIVNGANTNDVGMFGYVAMNGLIRNLILSAPIINITENTTDAADKTKRTINPLDDYLLAYAQALDNLNLIGSTSTSATFEVPETELSVLVGSSVETLEILYESTDTDILFESSPGQWTTVAIPGANPTDLYPVQLSARVFALYDNKVISYTLERWQINVNGNGSVTVNEDTVFKTIHPAGYEHETYVGIFIGHLDGGASYLGLWGGTTDNATNNGKIVVNGRAARSFNVLVGRSRTDNPLDATASNYYSRLINFNEILEANPTLRTKTYLIPQTPLTTSYTTQETRALEASTDFGLSTNERQYIRFYPTIKNNAITFDTQDDQGNITTGKPSSAYAARFERPLGAGVRATYSSAWYGSGWYNRTFHVLNGMWLWSTDKIDSMAVAVFGSPEFEVQFKMTYVAESTSLENNFQILYNLYNPDIFGSWWIFTWEANKVRNNNWDNLANATMELDGQMVPVYVPAENPLIEQLTPTRTSSGVIQEKTIKFVINNEDDFWSQLYSYAFNNEPYYPMFAVGVGRNLTTTSNTSGSTYRYYYQDFDTNYDQVGYAHKFTLDILSVDLLFTARDGNIANLLNNVDFLYSLPTATYASGVTTFTGWNRSSKVKIQFNVEDPAMNVNGTTYRFYREIGFNGVNSYVNVIYTAGTNYLPFNTTNFSNAVLTAGAA